MLQNMDSTTKQWLMDASDELAIRNGCWFDVRAGAFAVWWIERHCRLYEGEWAGDPMHLRGRHDEEIDAWEIPDEWDFDNPPQSALDRHEHFIGGYLAGVPCDWQYLAVMRLFGWMRGKDDPSVKRWGRIVRRFRQGGIWVPKKNKKPMALDTPIPTPGGWTTMGELVVGDFVFDENGQQCRVTNATEVYHDEDCYRVTFADGTSVVVGAGHEWYVRQRTNKKKWNVRETEYMFANQRTGGHCNYAIATAAPLDCVPENLPIDPYLLGAWLGDGASSKGQIVVGGDDADGELLARIHGHFPCTSSWNNGSGNSRVYHFTGLRTALRSVGVLNNKHIPPVYLRASREQRTALLNGLMDTDGCCGPKGQCVYVTTSKKLKDGVLELVRSLGFKATATLRPTRCQRGTATPAWRIIFAADESCEVFGMRRKAKRLPQKRGEKARSRFNVITSIDRVESVPVRCITVDSESHLYLAGEGMVPTHNSPTLAALGLYLLCGDGEPGQKVALAAKDGSQARDIAGKHTIEMVRSSPELSAVCKINMNEFQVEHIPSRSFLKPFSSNNERNKQSKEGFNGSILVDETHVVDRDFMKRVSRAGISRSEPIHLEVSTAGNNPDGYGKERFDYGADVAAGRIANDQFCYLSYAAPQDVSGDGLSNGDVIRLGKLANPAWGHTIGEEEFAADWQQSKPKIGHLLDFLMYRLNVWQKTAKRWLSPEAWDACGEGYTLESLRGGTCTIGLDVSKSRDMTAAVLAFPSFNETGIQCIRLWPHFWLPESYAEAHATEADFEQWSHDGLLTLTSGSEISIGEVYAEFAKWAEMFTISGLYYDPSYATHITQIIEQGMVGASGNTIIGSLGIERTPIGQQSWKMSQAIDDFENMVINGRIVHPRNEVLTWQIGNANVGERGGKTHIDKPPRESVKKTDGVIAMVMAVFGVRYSDMSAGTSVYDNPNAEVIWI